MAVNPAVLRIAAQQRRGVNDVVDGSVRSLTSAWVQAWDEVAGEWRGALDQLATINADGTWPSRSQLMRAERAMRALDATREILDGLEGVVQSDIAGRLPDLTAAAAEWQARITAAQMPEVAGPQASLAVRFNRVDPAALETIVARTTQQVTALTWPLSTQATQAMNATLIRGIAAGDNPRRTAAEMLKRVEGNFNGGLARALNIARTEQLDAFRHAGQAQDVANADVLAAWEWHATLDTRTCVSCLAQHGSRHELDVRGPDDHQQGRCARVAVTKTWRELGFNIAEPPSVTPDAKAWFDGLDEAGQLRIMGPTRLELYRAGRVGWGDMSVKRTNPGWRDSWAPPGIGTLRRLAA